MEKLNGKVAWFNNAKGYGFLSHDGGPDVFVHFSSIRTEGYKSLSEGDQVKFTIVQGEKGKPQADEIERALTSLTGAWVNKRRFNLATSPWS